MESSGENLDRVSEDQNDRPNAYVDWFLQTLVNCVNKSTLEIGITLSVQGLVISGVLISGKAYFKEMPELVTAACPEEFRESFKQFLAIPGTLYAGDTNENVDINAALPQYIDLRDARIFTSNNPPLPTNTGFHWRGLLSAVSGFSMGQLQTEKT